jgi:hypothetical protein
VWSSRIGVPGCLTPFLRATVRERATRVAGRANIEANFSGARNRRYYLSPFTGATAMCSQEHQGDEPVDGEYIL